jgi:hypothetical protein
MKYRNIPLDCLEDRIMEFCAANRVGMFDVARFGDDMSVIYPRGLR